MFLKLTHRLGLWFNVPPVLLLVACYFVHNISPAQFWPSAFLGLLLPYLAITNICFVLFWIFFRSWKFSLSLVALLFGYNDLSLYFQLSGNPSSVAKNEASIRVVSYNTLNLNYNLRSEKSNKPGQSDFIANTDADIICLQESHLHGKGGKGVFKNYNIIYPKSKSGPVILSKYKVRNKGEIRFENTNNKIVFADLQITESLKIRVYSCHLESYRIRPDDYSIIDSIDFDQDKKQLKEIRTIAGKLKYGFIQRAKQADLLHYHIEACEIPVVVCGDFNDTPASYAYHTVRNNLMDAFVDQGQWVQPTYTSKLPSFRIDYILFSDFLRCTSFRRTKLDYSDHYPIQADLKIPQD